MIGGEVRPDLKARPRRSRRCSRAQNYRSPDDILQFTNISRPRIGLTKLERIFVDLGDLFSRLLRVALHKILDQHRNVFNLHFGAFYLA
jgi:hypothetical protein